MKQFFDSEGALSSLPCSIHPPRNSLACWYAFNSGGAFSRPMTGNPIPPSIAGRSNFKGPFSRPMTLGRSLMSKQPSTPLIQGAFFKTHDPVSADDCRIRGAPLIQGVFSKTHDVAQIKTCSHQGLPLIQGVFFKTHDAVGKSIPASEGDL